MGDSGLYLSDFLSHILGWTFLHFLWQGALVASLLAITLAVIDRRHANLRYGVSCAAMLLLVLLPLATTWNSLRSLDVGEGSVAEWAATELESGLVNPLSDFGARSLHSLGDRAISLTWPPAKEMIDPYLPWLVHAWGLGAVLLLLRLAGGWTQLQSLRQRGEPDPVWRESIRQLGRRMGVRGDVPLLQSSLIAVPTVVGWLRPALLVPVGLFVGMPAQHVEAILVHELAHIRRHDCLVNMLQAFAECVLFFHPAVWWVSHRIRIEREFCCAAAVVSRLQDRAEYARALSALAEHRTSVLAVAANTGGLLPRIKRLLRAETRGTVADWLAPSFAASASVLCVFALSSALIAQEAAEVAANRERLFSALSRLRSDQQERLRKARESVDVFSLGPRAQFEAPQLQPAPRDGRLFHSDSFDFAASLVGPTPLVKPSDAVRTGSIADPIRQSAVYESDPSDPDFWIGDYAGVADVVIYRGREAGLDSVQVRERRAPGRQFRVSIRATDSDEEDSYLKEADIVVGFHTVYEHDLGSRGMHSGGQFAVDLDLSPEIDGKFRGGFPGPHSQMEVVASMIKVGAQLSGRFMCFHRDSYGAEEEPLLPVGEFDFTLVKRQDMLIRENEKTQSRRFRARGFLTSRFMNPWLFQPE